MPGKRTVLVVALLLVGCASEGSSEPTATGPITVPEPTIEFSPEGLGATLERYREDDSTGTIQIQVTSRAAGPTTVSDLRLVFSGFAEMAPSASTHVVAPGQRVDLPVRLGTAQCSTPPRLDEPLPDDRPLAVGMYALAGASPSEMRLPISDIRGTLAKLHRAECRAQAVSAVAGIAFDPTWTDITYEGKPASEGVLRVTRRAGSEPVTIVSLGGSVLLRIRPERPVGTPLVSLAAGQRQAEVPVILVQSGDCRPHAVAESKKTFFLPAVVAIGLGETVTIDVKPDAASQVQLLEMINRSCGLA